MPGKHSAGPVDAAVVDEFWDLRCCVLYWRSTVRMSSNITEKVADELLRLDAVEAGDEVNLWFEYELFCSVNLWFCLNELKGSRAALFRVAPVHPVPDSVWDGFGDHASSDLKTCFDAKSQFSTEDIRVGSTLWTAYRERDSARLLELGEYRSENFPFLKEVCAAAAVVDTRAQSDRG